MSQIDINVFNSFSQITDTSNLNLGDIKRIIDLMAESVALLNYKGELVLANQHFCDFICPLNIFSNLIDKKSTFIETFIHSDDKHKVKSLCDDIFDVSIQSQSFNFILGICKTNIFVNNEKNEERIAYYNWTLNSGFGLILVNGT